MGAKLGCGAIAFADGGARGGGQSGAWRARPRAAGPRPRMAEARCASRCGASQARRPARRERRSGERSPRLAAIDARLAEIDAKLKAEFPDFAALASPAPLPLAEAQALLGEDEALVLFLDTPEKKPTPEETFIWVATRNEARWLRSELGKAALVREVEALRCGLDAAAWAGPACAELTGQQYSEADAGPASRCPSIPPARTGFTRRCSDRRRTSFKANSFCSCRRARSRSCRSRCW